MPKVNYSKYFTQGGGARLNTSAKFSGFIPAEVFSSYFAEHRKSAFTLAEVLITLGIIGIVAALTLPALIQKNNNRIVETRLMKFYSAINQAVQRAEADYGDKKYWYNDSNSVNIDSEGKPVNGSSTGEKWFNKYIGSYMTVIKVEYDENARPTFFFKDGTALKLMAGSMQSSQDFALRDWIFYTSYPSKCLKQYGSEENARGKCAFAFMYVPETTDPNRNQYRYLLGKGFEPYKFNWDGSKEFIDSRCKNGLPEYCTALIQINNWKIPDDYPYKVSY